MPNNRQSDEFEILIFDSDKSDFGRRLITCLFFAPVLLACLFQSFRVDGQDKFVTVALILAGLVSLTCYFLTSFARYKGRYNLTLAKNDFIWKGLFRTRTFSYKRLFDIKYSSEDTPFFYPEFGAYSPFKPPEFLKIVYLEDDQAKSGDTRDKAVPKGWEPQPGHRARRVMPRTRSIYIHLDKMKIDPLFLVEELAKRSELPKSSVQKVKADLAG